MDAGMGFLGPGLMGFLGPVIFILILAALGLALYHALGRETKATLRSNEAVILAALLLLIFLGGGMMGMFGMGLGLLFWAALFILVYYLVKDKKIGREESALEILDRRYARGELSREEYLEMKKEIMET
jgi:putative membrane protein